MQDQDVQPAGRTRRGVLGGRGIASLALISSPGLAQQTVDLHVPGGPSKRIITTSYPQKGRMILQRSSPPWLETPFEVFDKGVFTPNDQHYVSWHWANFPGDIDVDSYRLTVRGQVNQTLSLSLKDILGLPRFDIAAVNDCAGEVMIAFAMNGEQLPLLNGFPLRLIVPGWCAVYWVKMLNDIEVLDQPDTNYWTATGYRVPDTPYNTVKPGETGFKLVPVTRNVPRSFITNIRNGDSVPAGTPASARGIAFGGDCGVARVDLSIDGGKGWQPTQLGADH